MNPLTAEELTAALLAVHDAVFEKRLQALAFITEIEWIATHPDKPALTGTSYYRTPRDVYSPAIRTALNDHDRTYSRPAYQNGHRTRKWSTRQVTAPRITERPATTIERITDVADTVSTHSLMNWCRAHTTHTTTGEKISLTETPPTRQ